MLNLCDDSIRNDGFGVMIRFFFFLGGGRGETFNQGTGGSSFHKGMQPL